MLEARLGLRFRQPERVVEALTHKSYANEYRGPSLPDNERLEFLGDSVLALGVGQRLVEGCPDATEGALSRLRSSMVSEEGLARVARAIELGTLLLLGRGEERTGGRDKASLLADALEALLAAVFLEHGQTGSLVAIDALFGEGLARARAGVGGRDHKTELQEFAHAWLKQDPRYSLVSEEGPDHQKRFLVRVEVGQAAGEGEGRTKQAAEQQAAQRALARLQALEQAQTAAQAATAAQPEAGPVEPG